MAVPRPTATLTIRDPLGAALDGASVTIRRSDGNGGDLALAALFDLDNAPIANPMVSDASGRIQFRADGGFFNIDVVKDAFSARRENFPLGSSQAFDVGASGVLVIGENFPDPIPASSGDVLTRNAAGAMVFAPPSGGGGGAPVAGEIVTALASNFEITIPMIQASAIIVLAQGVSTLTFWDPGEADEVPGGICYVFNMSGADVPFAGTSVIMNASFAGTGLKSGGLMQVIMPSGFSSTAYGLISGDLVGTP